MFQFNSTTILHFSISFMVVSSFDKKQSNLLYLFHIFNYTSIAKSVHHLVTYPSPNSVLHCSSIVKWKLASSLAPPSSTPSSWLRSCKHHHFLNQTKTSLNILTYSQIFLNTLCTVEVSSLSILRRYFEIKIFWILTTVVLLILEKIPYQHRIEHNFP